MRQYLRINLSAQRTVCVVFYCFLVVFSCVKSTGQQETQHSDSFSSLLQILDDGDVARERRDAEDFLADDGSGVQGAPEIVLSEQKRFVLKTPGKLSVDVGSTVYAVRGTDITVSCKASASPDYGEIKIEWLMHGTPVTDRFRGDVAAIDGALRIRRVGLFNEGTYTCRASNDAGATEALFTVKRVIPTLPTILKADGDSTFGPNDKVAEIIIGSDVTVYRGATLTIRCPVEGTGNPMVYWTNKGRSVYIGKAEQVGNDLVIRDIDKRYALVYTCTARTNRGKVDAESTVTVIALDPPSIKRGTRNIRIIEEESKEVEISVGTNLTVISDTQVTVRCEASIDPSPAIKWEIQGKDSDFKDIVSLSKDNSSLILSEPKADDSGIYTCTASNNVGWVSISSNIKILPPQPPRILYSSQIVTQLKKRQVLTAKIGDQLTLLTGVNVVITCPTSGLPTPTVQWTKDGESLSVSGGTLEIKNVTTQDSGVITCEAVNRAGRFSYSSEFRVIAAEKPEIESSTGRVIGLEGIEEAVVKIGQDLRVVEGVIVRLICPVRSGFPTPQVMWFLNDRMIKSSERFLIDTRSNSLTVNGIHLQDTGQVSCIANNSVGQATESSFISILGESSAQIASGNSSVESIKETKTVTIQIGDSLFVLSGSDVSIDCIARGTPPPVLNWRWNGREVISGARRGQIVITELSGSSRLTIQHLTSENAGQYECVATNTGGADRIASSITVLDGTFPNIDTASTSVEHITDLSPLSVQIGTRVTMLPGVRLEITCTASGIPKPVILWLRQGKQITASGRFSIHNGTLVVRATRLSDRGSFTCTAANIIGIATFSTRVDIIEPIKPRIMRTGRNVTIELISRLSEAVGGNILCRDGIDLELTCTVQGTPTPTIVWLRGNRTVGTGFKLDLGILKEESSGDYTCVATNVGGEDRKTTRLNVKSAIPPVIQSSIQVVEAFEEGASLVLPIGTQLRVAQGTKIDFICRVSGFPTPKVSWAIGNKVLNEGSERQGFFVYPFNGTSSTLLIRTSKSTSEDEVYSCRAYNGGGSVTAFSKVRFYERVAPSILSTWVTGSVGMKVSLSSRDPFKVTVGDDVRTFTKTKFTIECPVRAIPLARVQWTHNGTSVRSKHQRIGNNLVLSAESDISDSGRYTCAATNPLGRDAAWSNVALIEPTAPTITTSESSVQLLTTVEYTTTIGANITTVVGSNITFVCVSEGLPNPSVSWWKDGVELNVTSTLYTMYAFHTNATGVYSCISENLGGSIVSNSTVKIHDRAIITATVPRIITSRTNLVSVDDRRTVEQTIGGNVTILEGRDLLLRCPVDGIPLPSTSWQFNGDPVEISDTLQIDDTTGHLKITEMTPEEDGVYTCVATNIAGETREFSYTTVIEPTFPVIDSSNISIKVLDPARKPLQVKVGSKVTTLTGTPVAITCDVTGFPEPKISWFKGYTAITGSDSERLLLREKKINLLQGGRSDSGSYMCTASGPGGQAAAVSNITFVESVKPSILFTPKEQEILKRLSVNITVGEKLAILDKSNVTIKCMAKGMPPPSLSWSKDGNKLENAQPNLLHLMSITLEDSGRYTCSADNFMGSDRQSAVLTVRVGRKPSIKSKAQDVLVDDKVAAINLDIGSNLTLVAGSSVSIICEAEGVPDPAITWQLNGDQVPNKLNKTTLIIENPDQVNLQTISCTAGNVLGADKRTSHFTILDSSQPVVHNSDDPKTIEAQDRSPITLTIGDNVTALTNTSIIIQCPTSGVPTPTVTWTKDGQGIPSGGRYTVQDDGSLLISEAYQEDNARYTCTADSVAGKDSAASTVRIVEPAKPKIKVPESGQNIPVGDGSPVTMNIGDNVTATSNTTITIRCPVSGVPTPSVTWTRDGIALVGGGIVSFTSDNSLVISGAEDSARYKCNVQNVAGTSSLSSIVNIVGPTKPVVKSSAKPQAIDAKDQSPITLTIGDNVTALTNTSITIQCPTSGVPTPTVTWTKDGQEIPSGVRHTVQDDGSLLIRKADEVGIARYKCTADNASGKDSASSTVQVVEPAKPVIEVPESGREIPVGDGSPVTINIGDNVTAASNTTITIRCPVNGVPTPSVTWTKDGVVIVPENVFSFTNDKSLVIKEPNVDDSAKYTCSVQNEFGKDNISSIVRIKEPSKPVIHDTLKKIEAQDRSPITLTIGDNVTALTNTSVTIQCPTSGVPTPTVTWTKDGQKIPSGGRYTVQDDGSLLISEADKEDSARYTCVADSVAGKDNVSSILKVVEPAKPAVEVPESGREIPVGDGSPVTINIGDNVTAASNTTITIMCPVSGVPTPSVIWTKDRTEIIPGDDFSITDDNSLVIKKPNVEDSAKYTCSVQSEFGKDNISSIVRIKETTKPAIPIHDKSKAIEAQDLSPITLTIGDNVTALTNTSITIQCPTSGVPTPTVTWTKDGQDILSGGRYTVQDDGSLLIRVADEQDNARYTCTADSVAGNDSASSMVKVVEPVKPVIKVQETGKDIPVGDGSPVTMNIGDNVTAASNTTIAIRCPVSGVPTPSVTWTKDGIKIVEGEKLSITKENVLIIHEAESEHSAKYTCSVESEFGKESLSSTVRIKGPSKPVIKISDKSTAVEAQDRSPITLTIGDNVTALTNTSITIQCPTSGVPTPTVTWTKDGQEIPSGGRYTVQDDDSLLISEADEQDNARYTCTAKNVAGKDSASSTVQIVEPVKPAIKVPESGKEIPVGDGSPVIMNIGDNVTAASNTTITIRCPVSGVPTPSVTWFKDDVKVIEGEQLFFSDNSSLVVERADVGDSAKYTCSIQSVFGKDNSSTTVTIIEPVRPQIISSVGNIALFDKDTVNITIGQNLLTVVDTKLSINCTVEGIPIPKVTWTKGNETLPSDGRMTVRNGTLVIAELETSDSGNYTCSSKNVAGIAAVSSNVTVAVPTPPEIIRTGIKDLQVVEFKPIEVAAGSTVLTISGNNVSLFCRVKGFPTPSVQWTKDGVLLETEGFTLRLPTVKVKDSGAYTCTATSSLLGLFDSTTTNLTVIALQHPIISTVEQTLEVLKIENVSVVVGDVVTTLDGNRVSMLCEVSGVPDPQVTWQKDGVEVQRGGKSFIIETASQSDSGSYMCIASNIAGKANATSQLSVLVGSAPKILSSQESMVHMKIDFFSIKIGSNLTTLASSGLEISCPATGFPKPSIQWYREGSPVQPGMTLNVDEERGTLFTLSISYRKEGTFTCEARNALGSDSASSLVTVLVPGAPQINVSRVALSSLNSREPVSLTIGQTLSVLSGTNVSIKCPVSGIPKPDVTWMREDNKLKSGGRLLVKNSVLTMNSIRSEDTGVYLCKATNLAGEVVASSIVNVTETSSPKISTVHRSLKLLQSGSFPVDVGTNVTTVTGNTLSIRCNATGVPVPQITWSRGDSLLDAKGPVYVLSLLTSSDSGRYQCTATNVDGAVNQDIRIDVLDGSAPKITSAEKNIVAVSGENEVTVVIGGNITTVVGTAVKILCPVTALPKATITWLFNGSSVVVGNIQFIDAENATFTMAGVTPEDAGFYSCVAKNPFGSASKTTFLSLIIPVEPKILSSNKDIKDFKSTRHDLVIGDNLQTLIGTAVSIRCPVTGNPRPVIEWKKSGLLLRTSSSLQIVNNALILLDSTKTDTGNYTCTATNGAGSEEKATVLKFMAPEKPSIRGEPINVESYDGQSITVAVGGTLKVLKTTTVNIRCFASGIPEPSVFWNSSSNMQPANKHDIKQEGRLLTIREVDMSDSGKYMCSAVNKAGEDSQAAVLEVLEASLPKIATSDGTVSWYNREPRVLPVGGTIEVLSGTKVTLTCKYSAFPQAAVQWTVLGEEGQDLEQDAGYEVINGSLVLMALQPSDSARYVCSVRNVAGTSSATTTLKVLDPQPPNIISSQEDMVSLSDIVPVQATVGSAVTALSGSRITIACLADGIPTPTVAWNRGEKLLHTSSTGNKTAVSSGILTIANATTDDTGEYLCTAMSEVGVDRESSKVTVIEPEKPIIDQPLVGRLPLSNKTSVDVLIGSDVTVITHTRVNITCQASGVPTPEITWLRDGVRLTSETNSSLVLIITTLDDAQQVTCFAENLAGKATLSTNIDVIEPVFPRIKSGEGEIIALDMRRPVTGSVGITVQMFSGTSLTLECSAEGSPQPSVSWTRNGEPLESKNRVSISNDGTMIIKNARVADTGRYMCSARSPIGETYEASSVYVKAPIRPRITRSRSYIIWYEKQPFKGKVGDNLTTLKGRKLTLTCPAFGLPQPAISWYRGGMRMKSGGNYVAIGNTLIMFNLDPMDTDRYTCVARNFAGVTSATTTLKVHDPMSPKIMSSYGHKEALQNFNRVNVTIGKDVSILQGSPLTMKCPVLGVPEPKIKWIKGREMLSSNDRMDMDSCTGILDIFKMELEDSGDYACVAENFLGMDISFSAVTVFEALKPSVEVSGRVYVSSGSLVDMHVGDNLTAILTTPISINCSARGIPKPRMRWSMNGRQLGNGGNYQTDSSGALVIKKLEDPGEFTCIAENFVGQDGASSFINVLDPTRPAIITPENPKMIEAQDLSPITLTIGENVTALSNTSITIQCPTNGVPAPTITWTVDGKEIHSVGRYTVQDDGSLLIREAERDDNGQYTCTSGNIVGNASASSTVQIVEPFKPVIEVSESGQDIPLGDGSPVTMNIGDNVTAASNTTITIRCPVSGVPTPSVTWTKAGSEITLGVKYSVTSDNSIVIEGAAADDSAEYTCSVKSVSGTDTKTSLVTILGPSKPVVKITDDPKTIEAQDRSPITLTIGDNVTALTNTSITIQCPTSGVPTPTVTWTKDDQEISTGGRYTVQDDGSLLISEADEQDNARYTCTAYSITGKDSASSTVQVVEPAKPVIKVPESGKEISVGDGSPVTMNIGDNVTAASNTIITIRCPVSGVPTPSVTWTKDGAEIIPGDGFSITSENSLVIEQAAAEDSAKYICSVQGFTGTDSESSTVKIVGPSKPTINIPDKPKTIEAKDRSPITLTIGDNVTALTNTNITIQCPTSGVPTPTVTWTKDGQEIPSGGRYTVQDDGSLLISEADEQDNARYTCNVDSVAGKDSASSTVQVVDLKKPSILVQKPGLDVPIGDGRPVVSPVGSQITELAFVKITLTCPTKGSPRPEITWKKDGVALVPDERYTIDDEGSLTIREAVTEDSGKFTCTAQNAAGMEEVTSLIDILEPLEPLIQPPKGSISTDDHRNVTAGVGSKIDAFKGAIISISCAVKGVPKPHASWAKDGQIISQRERVLVNSNGTLVIRNSSVEDSGNYTCTASSRSGQDNATSSVTVVDTMHPVVKSLSVPVLWYKAEPLTSTIGSSIRTLPGTQVSLTCPATGIPPPTISWRKGSDILPQTGSLFAIGVVDSDSAGQYTCVATNMAGSAEASSDVIIEEPTKPSINRSVEDVSWDKESPLTVAVGNRVDIRNGSSLILKCASSGMPPPKLTWTRGIQVLSDDTKYNISEHTLTISNVQYTDADEYTCTAANQAGQDAATTELVVKGPGGPIILPDRRVIVDVNSSKPVIAPIGAKITTVVNATVIMTCPNQGSPQPTVTWNHDQRFIIPGGKYSMNESSLVIRGVRLKDAGSYQCTASNKFGRDVESLSLTVTVPPLISNVKGTFEVTDIRELVSITTGAVVTIPRGVSVRIKCIATGIPAPTITWYRQREGMKNRYPVIPSDAVKVLYDNSLSISHTAVNDAAYYTCVATNVAGKDEDSTVLNIGTPPEIPSYWQGVKSRFNIPDHTRRSAIGALTTIVKGATLHIKCTVQGFPKPTITWVVATPSQEQHYSVLDDGTLLIPSADLDDEGNYTCIANNSYGTLKRTTTVSILVPPEILDRHFRYIFNEKRIEGYAMAHAAIKRNTISSLTVEKGYNLILLCTVVGRPTPRITWRRNRVLIKNDTRHLLLPNGVLLVRQVDVKESGQYKCVATNAVGKDQGSVRLTVKNVAVGKWKATAWSKCGNCVTHLRGWQERHISCVDSVGKVISDQHCVHKHKPSKRRRCTDEDCHVIWLTSAWSACSRSCGSHGIKLRNVHCVFAKSLKPAKGQCGWQEKPSLQESCNTKSCITENCMDKVKYCQRVKQIGMCPVYSRWCCNTCR